MQTISGPLTVAPNEFASQLIEAAVDLQSFALKSEQPRIAEIASLLVEVAVDLQRQNLVGQAVDRLDKCLQHGLGEPETVVLPILRELEDVRNALRDYKMMDKQDDVSNVLRFPKLSR